MSRPLGIVLLAFVAAVTAIPAKRSHTSIRGQIIAYRPAERNLQLASHVLNRESFLFAMGDSKPRSKPAVIKVVYEHFGYSDLSTSLLEKTPTLHATVRRDKSCDETYGNFVQNSPTLTDQASTASGDKLIFISPFENMKLSQKKLLKCYKMDDGDFQIEKPLGKGDSLN